MAFQSTPTISLRRHIDLAEHDHTDRNLSILLEANAETARQKAKYRTDKEKFEAESMSWPIDTEHALAFFGLMLGIFPPATILFGPAMIRGEFRITELWIVGILRQMDRQKGDQGGTYELVPNDAVPTFHRCALGICDGWSRRLYLFCHRGRFWSYDRRYRRSCRPSCFRYLPPHPATRR